MYIKMEICTKKGLLAQSESDHNRNLCAGMQKAMTMMRRALNVPQFDVIITDVRDGD